MSIITERQQYWREHVLAAASFDGTIVEYAKAAYRPIKCDGLL